MKIRLGYACISKALDITLSGMLTYTYFQKLGDSGYTKLNTVILKNFKNLEKILKYNVANNIHFYRLSSSYSFIIIR